MTIQSGQIHASPVLNTPANPGLFLYDNAGSYVSGALASGGVFIANSGVAVTVVNANVTANSIILFGLKTLGGAIAGAPFMVTVTPGTGFTVNAGGADTSTYNYLIIG